MIKYESTGTSFYDCVEMCKLADLTRLPVQAQIFGQIVTAMPGDNPHVIYKQWFPDSVG
jgi:hypothetical protein